MRKYFDMVGKKFGNAKERVNQYWRRLMNTSNHNKISEGAQESNREMTSAHKDQWRRPKQ